MSGDVSYPPNEGRAGPDQNLRFFLFFSRYRWGEEKVDLRQGFALGALRVFPIEGRVLGDHGEVRVQPKSMDVLVALARDAGTVVERDTLLESVWGARAVSDEPLTRCIGELRRALGDRARSPVFIETVPKRGYRLLVQPGALPDRPSPNPRRHVLTAGLLLLLLLASVWATLGRDAQAPRPTARSAPAVADRSVAILPLRNVSGDDAQDYLGESLAAELTAVLAKNPSLRVASQLSSARYRSLGGAPGDIAAALGVAYLVEGTARIAGERVAVNVNLIDPVSGLVLWSARFDEAAGDIFVMQDRIVREVASALEVGVLDTDAAARRTDPQAYMLYLQGRHAERAGNETELSTAIERYREALAIDETYAPAWSAMAGVYNNMAGRGFIDWADGFEQARRAAERAVAADPSYAGGHAELSWVSHRYDGDLAKAFEQMNRALAVSVQDTDVLGDAAVLLLQTGQLNEAVRALDFCIRRAPTDPRLRFNLGVAYKYADELDLAMAQFRYLAEKHPDYAGVPQQIAEVHLLSGRAAQAIAIWETMDGYNRLKGLALSRFALGERAASDALTETLIRDWQEKWPSTIADVYAWTGRADEAFRWLDIDFEKYGAAGWGEIKLQRWYDPLRGDPRWAALVQRAGFGEEAVAAYELALALPGR